QRLLGDRGRPGLLREVADRPERPAALTRDVLGDEARARLVPPMDDDERAFPRQAPRNRLPDAARAAGDERSAVLQPEVHVFLPPPLGKVDLCFLKFKYLQ